MLSIITVLSISSGCKTEPSETDDPSQSTTTGQTQQSETQTVSPPVTLDSGFDTYVEALGLSEDRINNSTISGSEMVQLLDKLVAYAAPDKLEEWETKYPVLRSSSEPLERYDMISALYLALWQIGGDYGYISPHIDHNLPESKALQGDHGPTWDLFGDVPSFDIPGYGTDHYGTAAWLYNVSGISPVDGKHPVDYDWDARSFRQYDNATYADALLALLRSVSIVEHPYSPADTANSSVITEELIARADANPAVTSEDHPRWTGFVLGYGEPHSLHASAKEIELLAEWGFNSARLMLHYEAIFSADAQSADLYRLCELDSLVAAAIENGVHLNIVLTALPGRKSSPGDASTDFVSTAELDLFINPEKQEQALNIYRTLAARYKDVPNSNLSISPFWEALNLNLSTGAPAPNYTENDVAAFLGKAIDAIREEDPDRLIIYEPTPFNDYGSVIAQSKPIKSVADSKGNVIISYNACEPAYVYAAMNATEGRDIDNANHSIDLQPYPNYIYSVADQIEDGKPITLNGCLPAGTVLELYIDNSNGGMLDISGDEVSLYSEEMAFQQYNVGDRLSGFYPYAQSDKCISVTLGSDTDRLVISCRNGYVKLCGIYLTLPEEYARERWYYVQPYDVYLGLEEKEGVLLRASSGIMLAPNDGMNGRSITINDDLTYTSEHIWAEASADTVYKFAEEINSFDGNCVIRFERGSFSGTIWSEQREYYEDLLKSYEEYGFSWWSNDWYVLTNDLTSVIAESKYSEYGGYEFFNLELLQLLQQYQSKD